MAAPAQTGRSYGEVPDAGDLQTPDHGRVLRIAARLQAPVRRPQHPARLPAGRSRSDQRGRLSRPLAGARTQGAGRTRFAQAAGQGQRQRHRRRRSQGLRSCRSRHAGAAISLAGCARTARGRRAGQCAVHVDHEHAAARLFAAHPGSRHRRAQGRLHRRQRLEQLRSRLHHALQPRPAGDQAAGGEGQHPPGDAADQLQGGALSCGKVHRDAAAAPG